MKQFTESLKHNTHPLSLPLIILLVEYGIMSFSGVSYLGLSKPVLYSYTADPFYWFVHLLGLPDLIFDSPLTAQIFSLLPFFLIPLCIFQLRSRLSSCIVMIYFFVYYIILTSVLGHHNFQIGLFITFFPLLFAEKNQYNAVSILRYWILLFYLTAALYKITDPSIFDFGHFSQSLEGQFTSYRLEHSDDFRLVLNQWLISNPIFAQFLFFVGIGIELTCLTGFFSSKHDKIIGVCLVIFHIGTWILMDIAPIGQLSLLGYLFIDWKKTDSE